MAGTASFCKGKSCNFSFAQDYCIACLHCSSDDDRIIRNLFNVKAVVVKKNIDYTVKDIFNVLCTFSKIFVAAVSEHVCIIGNFKVDGKFYVKKFFVHVGLEFCNENRVLDHQKVGFEYVVLVLTDFFILDMGIKFVLNIPAGIGKAFPLRFYFFLRNSAFRDDSFLFFRKNKSISDSNTRRCR